MLSRRSVAAALLLMFMLSGCAAQPKAETTAETAAETAAEPRISVFSLPSDSVASIEARGLTEGKLRRRASYAASYAANRGYEGSGVVISPYYSSASAGGAELPIYATPVYTAAEGGALHSFAAVYADESAFPLEISAKTDGFSAESAEIILTEPGAEAVLSGGLLKAVVPGYGTYSILYNGGSASHALSVTIAPSYDEAAEIDALRAELGAEKVKVYESGTHYVDPIAFAESGTAIYIRSGALLICNSGGGVMSDEENAEKTEPGASESNGVGLTRYPAVGCHGLENIRLEGRGAIDFTQLDWHERRGIVFDYSENIVISGLTLINAPEWNIITYMCDGVEISGVTVLGYRTNSDAFAICNSKNVSVSGCFARSGDDLFEVKTLGGGEDAVASNIDFSRCTAWNGKCRCFGVIGEVNRAVDGVVFRDSVVVSRDGTWDNDILGSLVVAVGEGGAPITNVRFENIAVFGERGRAINVCVYGEGVSGCEIDVSFSNVSCESALPCRVFEGENNKVNVSFADVSVNGEKVEYIK